MSKYIIELDDRIKLVTSVGVTENGVVYTTSDYVHNLEELNSDYINEHYGSLQDDAYQKGLEEGKKQAKVQAHLDVCHDIERVAHGNYQKGLDDAWEAVKKISLMSPDEIEKVFPGAAKYNRYNLGYSGVEAIEKLKAYEEKQNDEIEVGDEVLWFMKGDDEGCDDIMDVCAPSVVTMVPNKECDDYTIIESSGAMTVISKEQIYKKTGRHFDIASILEDMKK